MIFTSSERKRFIRFFCVTSPVASQRWSFVWDNVWWQMSTEQWWSADCPGKAEETVNDFVHAEYRWVSKDRKWRSVVGRQHPTGWVIALPGRTARREIKGQTQHVHAVSRLATSWTVRGSNNGRSKRVSFLKKHSERLWSPPSVLFNG